MKNLKEYIDESLVNESSSNRSHYEIICDVIDGTHHKLCITKNDTEKKVMKAFVRFTINHINELAASDRWDIVVDDIEDYITDEAYSDFLNNYKQYKIKDSDVRDIDDMNFDALTTWMVKVICKGMH